MPSIQHTIIRSALSVFLLITSADLYASQADIDIEKSEFIKVFSGPSLPEMKEKAKELEYKGYSDPQIFDLIEKRVQGNMAVSEKQELDAVAWLVKALAFSGNEKYLPTLNRVANEGSEKLRRHATGAISDLPQYANWNSVINKGLVNAPAGKLNQQRAMNLIQSGDTVMVRVGLRNIYDNYSSGVQADKELLDEVKKMLLASIEGDISRDQEDNVAWMCKILGNTGDPTYTSVLSEVVQKVSSPKIKKYAMKSM